MRTIVLVCAVMAVLGAGCRIAQPTATARRASYDRALFAGDERVALRQTCFLIAGDEGLEPPKYDPAAGTIQVASRGGPAALHQGLAVAVAADGYLLTAGHVLGARNYVLASFADGADVRPARVVYRRDSAIHGDVALLKVEGRFPEPVAMGEARIGDRVFAVVCDGDEAVGGTLGFISGIVQRKRVDRGDRANGPVRLIDTDLPVRKGDSGGPVFSAAGQLVGVTTGFRYEWYLFFSRYYSGIAFVPDRATIESLIAADRAGSASRSER